LIFSKTFINVTDIDNLFINDSIAAVNSSAELSMNTSAEIKLAGLNFTSTPTIFVLSDFTRSASLVSSTGSTCSSSVCTDKSFNSSTGTLVFNVTRFSSYSVKETVAGAEEAAAAPSAGRRSISRAVGPINYTTDVLPVEFTVAQADGILFPVDGERHIVRVLRIFDNSVELEVRSHTITATLSSGEDLILDLNENGADDIAITLVSQNVHSARIRIEAIEEAIPISPPTAEVVIEVPSVPKVEEMSIVSKIVEAIRDNLGAVAIAFIVILIVVSSLAVIEKVRSPEYVYRKSYDVKATKGIISKARSIVGKDRKIAIKLYNDAVRAYQPLEPEKKRIFEKDLKELKEKLAIVPPEEKVKPNLEEEYDVIATKDIFKKSRLALKNHSSNTKDIYYDALLAYKALSIEKKKLFDKDMEELASKLKEFSKKDAELVVATELVDKVKLILNRKDWYKDPNARKTAKDTYKEAIKTISHLSDEQQRIFDSDLEEIRLRLR